MEQETERGKEREEKICRENCSLSGQPDARQEKGQIREAEEKIFIRNSLMGWWWKLSKRHVVVKGDQREHQAQIHTSWPKHNSLFV